MSHLPIERGIPIPPACTKRGGRPPGSKVQVAWASLQPGDSVFVPVPAPAFRPVIQARLMTNARRAGDNFGRVFITRAVEGGVRVWRTE